MDCNLFKHNDLSRSPDDQWEEWMAWEGELDAHVDQQHIPLSETGDEAFHGDTKRLGVRAFGASTTSNVSNKKRKVLAENSKLLASSACDNSRKGVGQNRSHSIVEKRYRTNLNDKIAELGRKVPCLRSVCQSPNEIEIAGRNVKHNKATVLSKAIEYIEHLEKRNAYLENACHTSDGHRCNNDERSVENKITSEALEESVDDVSRTSSSPVSQRLVMSGEPQGMIRVPEDIRKLRDVPLQPHYADQAPFDRPAGSTVSSSVTVKGSKFIGKLLIGSLACLTMLDKLGRGRREASDDRGLFSLPFPALPDVAPLEAMQTQFAAGHYVYLLLPLTKGFLVFSALGLALFLYLFNSRPKTKVQSPSFSDNDAVRSSIAPAEVRQNAWLTAIQTVRVPRHSMLPEIRALILETLAYLARQSLGWRTYSWLTGRNEDDEIARVRAWEIALDAQLSGGDAELSRSRLVLTLWAAGTLPKTPSRLMLKALHIRVTFWQASRFAKVSLALDTAASQLASFQWAQAQRLLNTCRGIIDVSCSDILPNHLVALLQQSPQETLTDSAVQYVHNLAYNRSGAGSDELDTSMTSIVEDTVMRGSLDALAIWSCNGLLHAAMQEFLRFGQIDSPSLLKVNKALDLAPPGSKCFTRALTVRSILSEADREKDTAKLLGMLVSSSTRSSPTTSAGTSYLNTDISDDMLMACKCLEALVELTGPLPSSRAVEVAIGLLEEAFADTGGTNIITYTARYQLLLVMVKILKPTSHCFARLTQAICKISTALDSFLMEGNNSFLATLNIAALRRALNVDSKKRRTSNASYDTGYESMNDEDEDDSRGGYGIAKISE